MINLLQFIFCEECVCVCVCALKHLIPKVSNVLKGRANFLWSLVKLSCVCVCVSSIPRFLNIYNNVLKNGAIFYDLFGYVRFHMHMYYDRFIWCCHLPTLTTPILGRIINICMHSHMRTLKEGQIRMIVFSVMSERNFIGECFHERSITLTKPNYYHRNLIDKPCNLYLFSIQVDSTYM